MVVMAEHASKGDILVLWAKLEVQENYLAKQRQAFEERMRGVERFLKDGALSRADDMSVRVERLEERFIESGAQIKQVLSTVAPKHKCTNFVKSYTCILVTVYISLNKCKSS